MNNNLLNVNDLKVSFYTHAGEVKAVNGVSFNLGQGEVIGIVGESGSGKSVTSYSIIRLIDSPGKIIGGSINFNDQNLLELNEKEMQNIRGNEISMIFQDPMTSLNPVFKIGYQLMESIIKHQGVSRSDAKKRAIEMLRLVGIPSPEKRMDQYPHEFSGGMRQRAMIAMALSCNPKLLIADEPTTALDVTIQAQILELMKELKEKINMSIILITHDLGIISDICDRVIIMYAGKVVEEAPIDDIFYRSKHPYTWGLLRSIPKINADDKERLVPIEGHPVDLLNLPKGCPFAPRCEHCMNICLSENPPFAKVSDKHKSACWLLFKNKLEEKTV
jgi:oligopeptide transport system ATP-binding protein